MDKFFEWLSGNSVGAIAFMVLVGLALLALIMILVVGFLQGRELILWPPRIGPRPEKGILPKDARSFTHDVFISSPMAAYATDDEYKRDREAVFRIIEAMRMACGYSVSYAGRDIHSIDDFDAPDISIANDLEALEASELFVMLYPRKFVSSVLVEAGFALALGKPSVYFVRQREDLPFLLRYAEQARASVKIYETVTTDDVIHLIERNKHDLFVKGKNSA